MRGSKFKKYREKANISLNTVSIKSGYSEFTLNLFEEDKLTLRKDQNKMLYEILERLKLN